MAFCKERMAAYKYPRRVEVRDELPKTVTGKIVRRELRQRERAAATSARRDTQWQSPRGTTLAPGVAGSVRRAVRGSALSSLLPPGSDQTIARGRLNARRVWRGLAPGGPTGSTVCDKKSGQSSAVPVPHAI
jgi:hypothetical protein